MVRHFIMSYRLHILRQNHSDTKIIDIAIFDGKKPPDHLSFINLIQIRIVQLRKLQVRFYLFLIKKVYLKLKKRGSF